MESKLLFAVPSVKIGTVSLKRQWYKQFVLYFIICGLLTFLFLSSKSSLNLEYFQSVDVSDINPLESQLALQEYRQLYRTFKERNNLLEKVCNKYSRYEDGENVPMTMKVPQERFYYMKNPNFLMCMIPKVASTTFSRFLLSRHQMAKDKRAIHNLGYDRNFDESVSNETYKTMVVRHPMERLLSAYIYIFRKEVQADPNRTNIYANMTKLLLQNYRPDFNPQRDILSFPEFVRYVVNRTVENIKGEWPVKVPGKDGNFWRIDDNFNGHWLPYWKLCTPCNMKVQPTKILKMGENLDKEVRYIFQESGVYDYFRSKGVKESQLKLPTLNPTKEDDMGTKELAKKYFSQITKENVQELYKTFRIDHELFGYDIEPYLSLAKE